MLNVAYLNEDKKCDITEGPGTSIQRTEMGGSTYQ